MSDFRFVEFNERRQQRGAIPCRVAYIEDGEEEWLWMTKQDIAKNMMIYGRHPELVKAFDAYSTNSSPNVQELL